MNLLESYIKEIHSVTDVTKRARENGLDTSEPWLEVDLTCDCYGCIERKKKVFSQREWEYVKNKGWFWC